MRWPTLLGGAPAPATPGGTDAGPQARASARPAERGCRARLPCAHLVAVLRAAQDPQIPSLRMQLLG
eukprot:5990090-Pyramimonas_sp.AAC.1